MTLACAIRTKFQILFVLIVPHDVWMIFAVFIIIFQNIHTTCDKFSLKRETKVKQKKKKGKYLINIIKFFVIEQKKVKKPHKHDNFRKDVQQQ